jgi:DNA-binding MurR/RpiR family transcriptional regulator
MADSTVEALIHDAMEELTAAERRAARALLANYPTIGLAPLAEFAETSGASAATVLRFVARIGFENYPGFQRRLRGELDERIKSPLEKARAPAKRGKEKQSLLENFLGRTEENLRDTFGRVPASEFEAVCRQIANLKSACYVGGGRFTDMIAGYFAAHLQIVRPEVKRLDGRPATRIDQVSDVRAGDTVVLFDVRRYDGNLAETAAALAGRRAQIVLVTDFWISPISRHAKFVLPCRIDVGRTWDSNAALFFVVEAMIARVTELAWETARPRIEAIEKSQTGTSNAKRAK